MKPFVCILMLVATVAAIEPSPYQPGVLVHAMVGGSAPGTSGGNCYTLVVRVDDVSYVAQQCPNFYWNSFLAHEFVEGGPVRVRFEKDKLMVLRPNGKELKARITRKIRWELYEAEDRRVRPAGVARGEAGSTF